LIEGDGIGPEQSAAAKTVLGEAKNNFDLSIDLIPVEAGDRAAKNYGVALPDDSLATLSQCDCCLKGPVGESAYDAVVRLRQQLNLYANVRPAKSMPNVPSLNPQTDLVIVRENTEDLYIGLEEGDEEKATATRLVSRKASQRIARFAFDMARRRRRTVTAVHKANVMKKTDGLFLSACREVADSYQDIDFRQMLVDAAAMNLIRRPDAFDVIVTTNMFGDILSDEAAQVAGGIGLAASGNIGDNFAIFEPVHGSAPDIAGRNIANPTSMILSTVMMLEWLSERNRDGKAAEASQAIRKSVEACLAAGETTVDLGGKLTTLEMAEAVSRRISQRVIV
jgi:3-isopropylmalate dehydrogenase